MTEHSNPQRGSKGRHLRLPPRKGLWLFDYEQAKYDTPFQRTASSILGCLALIFGVVVLWVMWRNKIGNGMTALLAVAALAYGLVNAPVGIVYWFRRSRGEATDYFDYEIVDPGKETNGKRVNDAPDHR